MHRDLTAALNQKGPRGVSSPPLSHLQVLVISRDVALGLQYLHTARPLAIVHRDLKPLNILLNDEALFPRAFIADFGAVRELTTGLSHVMTANHFHGTQGFRCPTYFRTGQCRTSMDIYAFGMTLLLLLTKDHIRDRDLVEDVEETGGSMLVALTERTKARLNSGDTSLATPILWGNDKRTAALIRIVARCVADDVKQRLSAAELTAELQACLIPALQEHLPSRALAVIEAPESGISLPGKLTSLFTSATAYIKAIAGRRSIRAIRPPPSSSALASSSTVTGLKRRRSSDDDMHDAVLPSMLSTPPASQRTTSTLPDASTMTITDMKRHLVSSGRTNLVVLLSKKRSRKEDWVDAMVGAGLGGSNAREPRSI